MTYPSLGLGVIGAGRFAAFVADAVADLPEVDVRAVTDQDPEAAAVLAKAHEATTYDDVTGLVSSPDLDIVLVATPPASHAAITTAALQAGKHVFCEKPLATTADDLTSLAALAADARGSVVVVDHVLRYNPLLRGLLRLQERLLGAPQRFLFENDASDEDLHDRHWFWDEARSGGIFVEHGVHFFDAATMLVGLPVTSVQATTATRTGSGFVDMVSATAQHGPEVLATHTHSFTHAHRCERQLMRLDYGAAEARIEGWIPVVGTVDVWTDDAGVELCEELDASLLAVDGFRPGPETAVTVHVTREAAGPTARGRGRDLQVPHRVRIDLTLGGHEAKSAVYAESVRAAMADLAGCARSGGRPRSGLAEGVAAVAVALAATRAARIGATQHLSGGT